MTQMEQRQAWAASGIKNQEDRNPLNGFNSNKRILKIFEIFAQKANRSLKALSNFLQ